MIDSLMTGSVPAILRHDFYCQKKILLKIFVFYEFKKLVKKCEAARFKIWK